MNRSSIPSIRCCHLVVFALLALAAYSAHVAPAAESQPPAPVERPRLLVLTDISSLRANEAEPDDGQSLVRLLLYANDLELEGLIATSNLGHGERVRPELLLDAIAAYAQVQPRLAQHDSRYPSADQLRTLVHAGQPHAGRKMPIDECVGANFDTAGSRAILRAADRNDSRPLWIAIWGGSADLAQALWRARAERSADDLRRLLSRLRVHAINDQDSTGEWIRREFPSLDVIVQDRAYRGMYRGGDSSLVDREWVQRHVHGHGRLGDLYPNYNGGDIFGRTHGPVRGVKEGDTPSFLFLVPNGFDSPRLREFGGWGGRFARAATDSSHWRDVPDLDLQDPRDPDPRTSSVYRWRADFQGDFAARLDWCIKSPQDANHPPRVRLAGPLERSVALGHAVELDASASDDPDRQDLSFEWSLYPRPAAPLRVEWSEPRGAKTRLVVADAPPGAVLPVLLVVRDSGDPPLTRYGRALIRVQE